MTSDTVAVAPVKKKAAARAGGWLGSRIVRGLREAPAEIRAWRDATEYDDAIAAAKAANDPKSTIIAQDRKRAAIHTNADRVDLVKRVGIAVASGGWLWVTLLLAAGTGVMWLLAEHAEKDPKAERCPKALAKLKFRHTLYALLVSVALEAADWYLFGVAGFWDVHYLLWPFAAALVVLAVVVVWVGPDGSIADNLQHTDADQEEAAKEDAVILARIKASGVKLGEGAELTVVAPGVIPLANGNLWKITLDTGGPSAEPLVAARDDIASRLGLSESRLIVERHHGYGRRVDLTGIIGDPWGRPTRSPLMDAQGFAFGKDPLPYGRDIYGNPIDLPMFEMHYLIGGMPRKGKSTSCYPIWVAAAMDPLAPIWVIDGGEVDTVILRNAGLTRRWTTDPVEAYDVLEEIEAEVEHRQSLLGAAELKRPNAEFYAEHQMSDGLVAFDEFASFTNHPDTQLAKKISRKLVSLLQRSPKSNIHFVLSTQSPSSQAFDTDGRGVVPGRIALLCDSSDMSDKVLGRYTSARLGIDASKLPQDVKGVQWIRTSEITTIARPHLIDDDQMPQLIDRARRIRGLKAAATNRVPELLLAALLTVRQSEAASMRSAELVDRLSALTDGQELPAGLRGQQVLAMEMAKYDVRPTAVRADNNLSHYLLADLEAAVARLERGERAETPRRLRVV